MKLFKFLLIAALTFFALSCEKETITPEMPEVGEVEQITHELFTGAWSVASADIDPEVATLTYDFTNTLYNAAFYPEYYNYDRIIDMDGVTSFVGNFHIESNTMIILDGSELTYKFSEDWETLEVTGYGTTDLFLTRL